MSSAQPPAQPRRRPSPVPLDQRAPNPKKTGRTRRWLPLAFWTAAIVLAATAGLSYVFAPQWFGGGADEPNVGAVPTVHGKLVSYLSPRMIQIPKLHARAPIVAVRTQHRELQIPLNPKVVGWWNGGAKPGQRTGTAILAGHINYSGVSGVLARIGTLKPGDKVYVTGTRGPRRHPHRVRLRFSITGVKTYKKTALPYRQIFDQKSVGRLAIVTCGGAFDSSTGNYEDNIVAFAVPA